MKRLLAIVAALLIGVSAAFAAGSSVKDVDITVSLSKDGVATITEVWKIAVSEGTEWYLVRSNLGDIKISDLSVTDETGTVYKNEGKWDVDRSLARKAGKCGIVSKNNGCEICWGLGSYGSHTYTVTYKMSNVVKALEDYDMLHMQFVSPGLSAAPSHVKVTIDAPVSLSLDNSRIWGFGFYGDIDYDSRGRVVAESSERFSSQSSVIELIRFDKGIFSSPSVQDKTFDEVLQKALDGADFRDGYDDDTESIIGVVTVFLLIFFGGITITRASLRARRKKIFGVKKLKEINWCRDLPFDGSLLESNWVLSQISSDSTTTCATAMILKMVKDGYLVTSKDQKGRIEISFNDNADFSALSTAEKELYQMMKEASGSDVILQNKEFSRWSKKNYKRVNNWITSVSSEGWSNLARDKYVAGADALNESGQQQARNVIGFKNFLSDFTLSNIRETREVGLWQEYLIFAALYGIADKVAKELKDINPQLFEEAVGMDPLTYVNLMHMSNSMSSSILNAREKAAQQAAQKALGGMGGHTSFGGGGGFSGGGFGGGAR